MVMTTKADLKAHMLAYFRQIEQTGEPLIVTDRGRPVLKVVRIDEATPGPEEVFARERHRLAELGVRYDAAAAEPLPPEALADADWLPPA